MTYRRTMPRDLFNDASLLNMVGHLCLLLEDGDIAEVVQYPAAEGKEFDIGQDPTSGWTHMRNIAVHALGENYQLCRPLNTREKWCLYVDLTCDTDFEPVEVFDGEGRLSEEFLALT